MTKQAAARTASTPDSLQTAYDALHKVLTRYVPPYLVKGGNSSAKQELHLVSPKCVTLPGHYGATPKQIGLASIILQRDYVGLHYVPLYFDPKLEKQLSPRLMKLLKGKTCFHVKQSDAQLESDIDAALKVGDEYFRTRGWI
jgi:hypothetical protein